MNPEIPKPLRNALARQMVSDAHPSPEVLTSFMERTLTPLENDVVTHHLAKCADCREIVFLASEAAENEVHHERELVAAASFYREAAMPTCADSARLHVADRSRPSPTSRMRWAMSIAAVALVVSGGLVLQHLRPGHGDKAAPITIASNHPAAPSQEARQPATTANSQDASPQPSIPPPLARAAPGPATAPRHVTVPAPSTVAGNRVDESAPTAKVASPPPAPNTPATPGAVAGGVGNTLTPTIRPQSSFAETEAGQVLQLQQGAPVTFGKARMGIHALSEPMPQWRISTEGHLERSTVPNQWTRVLDDQPITFRVVSVVANDVWVGGNNGALFHSADRGRHWSKVSLVANSAPETGAIVSIRFDDSQHGVVTSNNGTRWMTIDGGLTWPTQ